MGAQTTAEQKQLGGVIRERRNALGVSQEDFAEMCGFHRTYIGQIERGEKNISFHNLLRICAALGIEASSLLKEAGF